MRTSLHSVYHFVAHARISDESYERLKTRSYCVLGFLVRWVCLVLYAWLGCEAVLNISNVPMAQLTLAMLGKGLLGMAMIAQPVYFAFFHKGKVDYQVWGWCAFWGGIVALGVLKWIDKHSG